MANSRSKKEIIKALALKMDTDEKTAGQWLDGVTETFYETFKSGSGVSLTGFGSFYLERRRDSTAFKFNPSQKLRKLFGWSSSYKGDL
ncbi:MAG TPA: HU family DNA-binding protein [Desulfobacter sp.]|nr:HU family DNA-binding protein [Desulfobacter sp.]